MERAPQAQLAGPAGLVAQARPAGPEQREGPDRASSSRGAWTAKSYNFNDVVSDANSNSYVCVNTNGCTSNTDPSTDTSNWDVMAEVGATSSDRADWWYGRDRRNNGGTGAIET